MKLIAYILALYVVTLTILPCIDGNEGNGSIKTELSSNKSHTDHNELDHCSPFCSCSCCSSPVVFQNAIVALDFYSIVQKAIPEYKASYISSTHRSIWQPPKIS
jgi:hypothetical protein